MSIQEGDLNFDFSGASDVIKFDDGRTHVKSSIKPVDFVIEYPDFYRFVEVKDPDVPGASKIGAFEEKLKSGELIQGLARKYRDSIFFHRFQNHTHKDIEYIVLLSMRALDDAQLLTITDQLQKSIPWSHQSWGETKSASACVILNMTQWKKCFGNNSVWRRGEAP